MTDKMIDNMNGMELEPLSATDDQLLQAFFADNKMEEVPDDGFSDRVMQALAKRRRLEHLWTAACVAVGIVAAVVCQGWEQIQGWLFSMKIDFLLTGSRALTHLTDAITQTQNLLMMLAGIVVLVMVWGYNEVADARE
ncbi:DUF5056 domain-containing protein [Prevotella copri]|jgi:hypothetical protein|uniref:DUF5056 domain-containing protein n=1 Tax=Segatella copri TaxID=165179 RepID=A0AAP3BG04_9BACT|nr:DUF5056 domain-containing protein [Segatella copri]MCW4129873.1 DUF5056 domain-containing protein [Segatella copri]MCW4415455.1 DUF5056 domain-containing protein [Segatella copri]MCW4422536.1 DUF5056 domain-containing protein [Segatella copri]